MISLRFFFGAEEMDWRIKASNNGQEAATTAIETVLKTLVQEWAGTLTRWEYQLGERR
jgi:hypothetical protein